MIVQCPKCNQSYRVDDIQVPAGGCAVRCPSCENIFTIYQEPLDIDLIPIETEREMVPPEPVTVAPPEVEARPEVEVVPGEVSVPPSEEVSVAPSGVGVTPEVEVVPGEAPAPPAFVKPPEAVAELDERHERARRLARALVKDIVLYHPQEVETGLRDGRLSELVGDEIRKSWKYYKERIPNEIVDNTNYFKDALNEILCKGKKVFT